MNSLAILFLLVVSFAIGHGIGRRRGYRRGTYDGRFEVAEAVIRAYEVHTDENPPSQQARAMDRVAWRSLSHDPPWNPQPRSLLQQLLKQDQP